MEFIDKFKNYLLGKPINASQVTVKNYIADIRHFITWFELVYKKSFNSEDVSIQTIQEFKTQKASTLSESSIDRHISSLRKFFNFLKLDGQISSSPFDQQVKSSEARALEDPHHLHDFKNYLYVYNASHLTIKNYVIDVKQFLSWAEEVLRTKEAWKISDKNLLGRIDNKLVEEYKNRLLREHVFSPSSINRKLSSLRKYLSWAGENGYLCQISNSQYPITNINTTGLAGVEGIPAVQTEIIEGALAVGKQLTGPVVEDNPLSAIQTKKAYSNIPPVRLFQKLVKAGTYTFDLLIVAPIAHVFRKIEHETWKIKGKNIFTSNSKYQISNSKQIGNWKLRIGNLTKFKNISKEFYSPLSISTRDFPVFKKILFHIRHTRPQWYHRYHQLAIAHYFNWAVLIIFATAIGFGMYNNFVQKPDRSLAALPNQPIRVLSFQGRLTDANDNPITTPSWIRFEIYNNQTSSGSARLWEEVDKVSPDQDGIFSLLLGSSGASDGSAAALCNSGNPPSSPTSGACGIPQSLFANNNALWLGVTVESTSELAPREQLATVAFASNAETLQGLPPITQSGAGTNNVVLALNSSGNLSIGASTTFQSTSGAFNLSGNTVALNTNAGTNGNITLAPDGIGFVDIQRPVLSSSNYGDISSVPNAFTIEDLTGILATSSGQSALTIDQNGAGPIISASASGNAKFTVDNSGNTTANAFYTGLGTTYYINSSTSNLNSLTLAGNLTISGNVASSLVPSVNNTYSLGSPSNEWLNLYAQNIYSNGQVLSQLWQENTGALSPIHTRDDLIVGGTATSDAKFQVNGTTGQTYVGGQLGVGTANPLTASAVDVEKDSLGNSLVILKQLSTASTDILTASNSAGTTLLHLTSAGQFFAKNLYDMDSPNYYIDPAAVATSIAVAGTVGIGTPNPLTSSGLDVEKDSLGNATVLIHNTSSANVADLLTASNSAGTKFTIQNDGTLVTPKYATDKGILYLNGTTGTIAESAQGAAHTVLHGNGSSAPTFSAVDLTADVTGTLPINSGGTNGTATPANGQVAYGNGSAYAFTSGGTNGNCLTYNSGSAPSWSACATGSGAGTNYWQLNGNAVSPSDLNNDLAVGGNSTSSAKFQVFAESVGNITAGTATTSGNFTFAEASGTNPNINVLNGNSLKIKTSPGGPTSPGYIDALIVAPDGSLTSAGSFLQLNGTNPVVTAGGTNNLTLNSGSTGNIQFFGSSNTLTNSGNLTLAGTINAANSNTINGLSISSGALSAITGYSQSSGNFSVSGTGTFSTGTGNVSINGPLAADLIPTGNGSINLGSSNHYYNNVYALNFSSPVGNGTSGFWTVTNTTNLYPSSSADDVLIGGTATNSAAFQIFAQTVSPIVAGTASTSGYLTFKDAAGTNPQINILNGNSLVFNSSPGGDGGTGYAAILTLGNNSTTTTLSTASNNNLSLLAGNGITSIGSTGGGNIQFFGSSNTLTSGGNLTLAGTITLPHSIILTGQTSYLQLSDGIEFGGGNTYKIDSSGNATLANVLPTADGVGNIGSTNTAWNNVYAKNINLPITGGLGGFWQLSTGVNYGVLAPTNIQNDLAVGGNSTSSAAFQIFGQLFTTDASINSGNIPAGTASTSGNLSFRGSTSSKTVFQQNLLNGSDLGFFTSVGGNKGLSSTNPLLYLANSGSIGIGTNAPTTTLDVAGNASISSLLTFRAGSGTIQATSNNQITLGGITTGGITFGSNVNSNIVPTLADTFNLGSAANEWNNLYVRQIITPATGGIAGYWQLNSGALSPANLSNDLLIGGVSTTSATFHVFGASINQGTNAVASISAHTSFAGLVVDNTIGDLFTASISGITQFVINKNGSVGVGTGNPLLSSGIDIEKNGLGNSILAVNQLGLGDILTASVSGTTKFVINNNGDVGIGPGVTTAQGILDVASQGPNFPSDLTLNQTAATNLIPNPSFEYYNNLTNTWTFNRTPEFGASNPATESAVFGSHALRMNSSSDTGSTFTATTQCIPVVGNAAYTLSAYLKVNSGFVGNIGINFQTFTNNTCTTGQTTAGRVNTTITNQWTRISSTITTGATIAGIEAQWIADNSSTGIAYLDGVQLENNSTATPYLDGSLGPGYVWDVTGLPNATDSSRLSGSAFVYQTLNSASGIGAAGRTSYPTLSLDQNGSGDILTASASGVTELQLTNAGKFYARNLYDLDNPIYYIDPAGLTVSASLASSMTFTPTSEHDINFLNGSNLSFQSSVGGDSSLTSRLFIQGNSGNVGIGTTGPNAPLDISYSNTNSGTPILRLDNTATSNGQTVESFFVNGTEKGRLRADSSGNIVIDPGVGGHTYLGFNDLTASDTYINPNGGNIGIGTTSPGAKLDVLSSGTARVLAGDGCNGSGTFGGIGLGISSFSSCNNYSLLSEGTNLYVNAPASTGNIYFRKANVDTVTILGSSGDLGIGTTSPTRTLDVTGNWGGNTFLQTDNTNSTHTNTITNSALGYYLNADINQTSGITVTWNVTGLPNTEGTFATFRFRTKCENGGASVLTNTLKINNTTIGTDTCSGTGLVNEYFIVEYLSGGWVTIGDNKGNSNFDLAELIPNGQKQPIPGELLTNNVDIKSVQVIRSNKEYDQKALGIVTTNPNTVYGYSSDSTTFDQQYVPINGKSGLALAGRVPTIVTSLDGPIQKGDSITTSPLIGTGMKPLKPTQTVGKALEGFDPSQMTCTQASSYDSIVWPADDGSNDAHPCFQIPVSSYDTATQAVLASEYHLGPNDFVYVGKVMVLVGNSYVDPNVYLTTTGDIHITDASPSADFAIPHYYTVSDALGHPLTQMGVFLELAVGNLRAGTVNAQQVLTNSLAVATDNVSVAGQQLSDYIVSVVNNAISNGAIKQSINSPLASVDELHTNLISPLASSSAIALDLSSDSKINVNNTFSQQTVASIDNQGNATFSGNLNSQNLAVNGDATVSGTLYANNIKANSIEGLSEVVSTLSAQNITNINNIYFATPSESPIVGNISTGSNTNSSPSSNLLVQPQQLNGGTIEQFASIASYSAYFAYVPNLNATTGIFQQGLVSLGPTSLSDTSVSGTLSIGSSFILADNSINVLGNDFSIQPLRQGGVSFEGGLLSINTNGDLTVNGDAVFNKNLAVNTLSPIAGHDLSINLSNGSASNSATPSLNVNNASGSAIFAVNQLGDLVASGTATIGKLNLNLVQPALAISDTEVIATGSAGTATIKAYQREVTIDDPNVTSNSLIYITPVGTDQTPYLERQTSGKSFSVGIPTATLNNVNFNWLIVN